MPNGMAGRRMMNAARAGRWAGWASGAAIAGGGTALSWTALLYAGEKADELCEYLAGTIDRVDEFTKGLASFTEFAGNLVHYGLPVAGTVASIYFGARAMPRVRRAVREWYARTF